MENPIEKAWWQPALAVFGEVTGWIVAPILLALFGGRWLDERFGSDPWFYLGLTAAAVIVTVVGLVRIGSKYIRLVENMKPTKKTNERNNRTT